jgi:hypothetical protein
MKNILCKLVGHQPPVYAEKGWYSPGEEYGTLKVGGADATGRVHCSVYAECARCKEEFRVARVHLPVKEKS